MEYLDEKCEDQMNGVNLSGAVILANKKSYMEKQIKKLKKDCVCICNNCTYACMKNCDKRPENDRDMLLDRIRRLWSEIWECDWQEQVQLMNIYKVKACFFIGNVYVGCEDYDDALFYLKKAEELLEKNTFQYVIPEFYIKVHVGIAECCLRKHSPQEVIKSHLNKAEEVLKEKGNVIQGKYGDFYRDKLFMELHLQRVYVEMDKCGLKKNVSGNSSAGTVNNFDMKQARDAWKEIGEVQKKYDELMGKNNIPYPECFNYEAWEKKIRLSFLTTKGEYYKNLYFLVRDTKDLSEEDKKYISAWLKQDPAAENEDAKELQKECIRMAVKYFADTIRADNKNTISWNGIAALFYEYNCNHNDESKEFICTLWKQSGLKLGEGKEKEVGDLINEILDNVLGIEKTNMFALSIRTKCYKDEEEDIKLFKDIRIDDYPSLRQSSLKRWFERMERHCEGADSERFQDMEIWLIRLYCVVNKFMKSALVDFDSEEYRNLKVGHYTKMAVLPKLIREDADTRFRIYNVHHLNDPREGVIMIDYLKNVVQEEKGEDGSLNEKLWKKYDSDRSGAARSFVYMGSFTSRLDCLGMWEQYGDHKKGVALQFNAGEYFDKEQEISLGELSTNGSAGKYKRENIKYPLYTVLYLPDKGKADIDEFIKNAESNLAGCSDKKISVDGWQRRQWKMAKELRELVEKTKEILQKIECDFMKMNMNTKEKMQEDLCNTIMVILDLARFLIKSDVYLEEREYRVIQYSAEPECDSEGQTVPRLYIPIKKELSYEKVYFGPLVKDFESKVSYILNIKKNCKNQNIEVCKSAIDFREE